MRLNWKQTFMIGFGFLGISLIWQIYNLFVPLFLQAGDPAFDAQSKIALNGFGLNATTAGFVMTLDNIAALFLLPLIGVWSDRTRTRIGRRYPFILIGAPIAAIAFALIPVAASLINPAANGSVAGNIGPFAFFMIAAGAMLLAMALFRTPVIALMPDLVPSPLRSQANGVINFMGGVGGVIGALGLASLFDANHILPFGIGSALLIVAVVLLFVMVKEPPLPVSAESPGEGENPRNPLEGVQAVPREYHRSLILLMLAIFAWFVGYNAIETFFSSYAVTTLGVKAGTAGQLFSIALVAFILFAIPAGYVGKYLGRKRTISLGLVLFAILLVIAYLLPNVTVIAVVLALGGVSWSLVKMRYAQFGYRRAASAR